MEHQITNTQVAIMFINELSMDFDYTKFILSVKDNIENFRSTMPFTIPNSTNMQLPIDIPRLTYQNGEEQLMISASRIDYTFQLQNNDIEMLKQRLYSIEKVIKDLKIDNIYRVGVVLTCSINKVDMFVEIKKFVNFDDADISNEIQFSYLKNIDRNGLSTNQWIRYLYNKSEEQNNLIIDINNSVNTPFGLNHKHEGQILDLVQEVLVEIYGK